MSDDEEYDFDDFHEVVDEVFTSSTVAENPKPAVDNNASSKTTQSVKDLLSYFNNDADEDLNDVKQSMNESFLPSSVDVISVSPKSATLEYENQEHVELVNDYLAEPKDLAMSLNSNLHEMQLNMNVSNGGLQQRDGVEEEEPRSPMRVQPAVESISPHNANKSTSLTVNEKVLDTFNAADGQNSETETYSTHVAFDPSKLSSLKQKSLSRRKQTLLEDVSVAGTQNISSLAPTVTAETDDAPSSKLQPSISPKRKQIGLINLKLLERKNNNEQVAVYHSTNNDSSETAAALKQSIQNEFSQLGLDALSPVQKQPRAQPRPPMQPQLNVKRNAFGKIVPASSRKSAATDDKENKKDSALADTNNSKITFSDIGTGRGDPHNNQNFATSEVQPRKHRVSLKPAIPARRTRPAVSNQSLCIPAGSADTDHSTVAGDEHGVSSSAQQPAGQQHTDFLLQKQKQNHRLVSGPPRRSFVSSQSIGNSSSDSGTANNHNAGPGLKPRPPVSLKPSVPKQAHPRSTIIPAAVPSTAVSTLYEEDAGEANSGRGTAGSEATNPTLTTAVDVVGSRPGSHNTQMRFDTPVREEDDYFPDDPAPPLSAPIRSPLSPDRQPQTSRSQPDHQAGVVHATRLQKTNKANPRVVYSSPYRAKSITSKKAKSGKTSGVTAVAQVKASKKYHKGRDWMADPTHRYDATTGLFSSFETDAKREFRKEQVRVNAMLRKAAVEKEAELARVALMQRQHEIEVVERLHEQCSLVAALQEERAAAVLVEQRLAELRAVQDLEAARTKAQLVSELAALRKQQQVQSLPPPSAPSASPTSPPRRRLHFAHGPEPDRSPESGSKGTQSTGTEDHSPVAEVGTRKSRPGSGASVGSAHSYPRKGRQFVVRSTVQTKTEKSPTAKTATTRALGKDKIEKSPPKPTTCTAVKANVVMFPPPPTTDALALPATSAPTPCSPEADEAAQSSLTVQVESPAVIPVRASVFAHTAASQDALVAAVATAERNLHAEEQKIVNHAQKPKEVESAASHVPATATAEADRVVAGGTAGFAKSKGRISLEQLAALSAAASTVKVDLFGDEVDVKSIQHEIGLSIEDSVEEASPLEDSTYYLSQVKSMVGIDASDAQNIVINSFYGDSPHKLQQYRAAVGMSLEDAFTFAGELDLPLEGSEEVGDEVVRSAEEEEYGDQDWEDDEVPDEEVEEAKREVPPLEEEVVQQLSSPKESQTAAASKEVRIVSSLHITGNVDQPSDARSSSSNKVRRSSTPGAARRMQLVSSPASSVQMQEAFCTAVHRKSTPKVRKTPVSSRRSTIMEESASNGYSKDLKLDSVQSNQGEYAGEDFEADEYDDDFETGADSADENEQRVSSEEAQSGSVLEESSEARQLSVVQPTTHDSGVASSQKRATEGEGGDWGCSTPRYEPPQPLSELSVGGDEGSVQDSPLQGLRLGGSVDLDLQDSLTFSAAGDTLSYSPDRTGTGDFNFRLEGTTELSFYMSQPSLFEEELEPAQRLSDYPQLSQDLPAGTEEDLYGDDDFEEDVEELLTADHDTDRSIVPVADLIPVPAGDVYSGIVGIADVPNNSSVTEAAAKMPQLAVDLTDSLGEDELYSFAGAVTERLHTDALSRTWAPAAIASAAHEYDDEFETGEHLEQQEDDEDGLLFFNNGQLSANTAIVDASKSNISLGDEREFDFIATTEQNQENVSEPCGAVKREEAEEEYSFAYKPSASAVLSVSTNRKETSSTTSNSVVPAFTAKSTDTEKPTAPSPYSVRNFSMVVGDSSVRQQQSAQQNSSTGGSYGDRKTEILRRIQQQQLTEDSDEASDQETAAWEGGDMQTASSAPPTSEKSAEPQLSYLPSVTTRSLPQQQQDSSLPLPALSRAQAHWRPDEVAEGDTVLSVQQSSTMLSKDSNFTTAQPVAAAVPATGAASVTVTMKSEEYEDDGFEDEDMDEVDISETNSVESRRISPNKRAKASKKDKKARKKAKKASKRSMEELAVEGSSGEEDSAEEQEVAAVQRAVSDAGSNVSSQTHPASQWSGPSYSGAANKETTAAVADEYEDEFDFEAGQHPAERHQLVTTATGGEEEEYADEWADAGSTAASAFTDSARRHKKSHKHKKEKKGKHSKSRRRGDGAVELVIEEDEDGWERGSSSRGSSTDGTQSTFSTYNASPTRETSSMHNAEEEEFPEDGSMFSRSSSRFHSKSPKKHKKEKKSKSKHKHKHSSRAGSLQDLEGGSSRGSSAEEDGEFEY